MQQINDCIGNPNQDWEKRVDSVCYFFFFIVFNSLIYLIKLKRIRSLAIICQNQHEDEFFHAIRIITVSMQQQIKDLRSQIVREACITVA